jgi:hypothetical protein
MHIIKIINILEGILTQSLHALCHIGMDTFILVLDANTFSDITSSVVLSWELPSSLQQLSTTTFLCLPLPEVVHHWKLSFLNNSNHFLDITSIITITIILSVMSKKMQVP